MTPSGRSAYGLLGRQPECEHLGTLLHEVEQGHGAALVVRGEPGVGKTALRDWVAITASDFKVVRVTGVEAEADLAFGALHQLCVPFMIRVQELPEPQAAALAAVFGLRETSTPDRFLTGLALLSLLSLEAVEPPCCVLSMTPSGWTQSQLKP